MDKKDLVVVVGPTAIGKTDLGIKLAQKLNGEIVSADSMQIYKYMDIGTAKPHMEERQGIPHHMMDIIEPDESFNVALYQEGAKTAIEHIYDLEKLPILVGGSGLYINSIVYPLDFTDATEDLELRDTLYRLVEERGNTYLHEELSKVDPDTASRVHPNDVKRVVRALEIYRLTGKPMSKYRQNFKETEIPYNVVMIGLHMARARLYERINLRVDHMIDTGLIDEVKSLLDMGYTRDLISMQGLGYKEIVAYLEGDYTLDEAVDILKRDTRRFAKRQFTWFKKDSRIQWLDIENFQSIDELSGHIVQNIDNLL